MRIRRWADVAMIVLLVFSIVLPPLSWLLWSLGFPVRSMLSPEGLRWMFQHVSSLTFGQHLHMGVQLVMAWSIWCRVWAFHSVPAISRFAMTVTLVLSVFYMLLIGLAVWGTHSPLLSITGTLAGSPLLCGLPSVTLCFVALLGLLHALIIRMVGSVRQFVQLLCAGLTDHPVCMAMMAMTSYCAVCLDYIFY
ncbi:MAG: hypothetical protein ACI3X9_07575 [Bacteroidaceae bacterium]